MRGRSPSIPPGEESPAEAAEEQTSAPAFQDLIPGNGCWGCGPDNAHGLRIKSRWVGDEALCLWQPSPWHSAGPPHILNGGIIATIIDCHAICTAIADAYRVEGRALDSDPPIWYATASLQVQYLRPTPIDPPVELRASVRERTARKSTVVCALFSGGERCAEAELLAVRVPEEWRHGR